MHLGVKQRSSGLLIRPDIRSCYITDALPWYKENEKSSIRGEIIWLILSDKIQVNEQNLEGRLDWWGRQGIQGSIATCLAEGKSKNKCRSVEKPRATVKYWANSRRNKAKWPATEFIPHHITEHSQNRCENQKGAQLHHSFSPPSAVYEK